MSYEENDEERLKKLKPMFDQILIDWEISPDEYEGTQLIRPDTHKLMHHTGVIISKGPDVMDLEVGDRVLFDRFSRPEKFYFPEKRYALIRECDCMATLASREEMRTVS